MKLAGRCFERVTNPDILRERQFLFSNLVLLIEHFLNSFSNVLITKATIVSNNYS
jgi:hypothetical protein